MAQVVRAGNNLEQGRSSPMCGLARDCIPGGGTPGLRIYPRKSTHGWWKQHQHTLLQDLPRDEPDSEATTNLIHGLSRDRPRKIGSPGRKKLSRGSLRKHLVI